VTDKESGKPVEFAYIVIPELSLWAVANENGSFNIHNIPKGRYNLSVQCMGYEKYVLPVTVNRNIKSMMLRLTASNLKVKDVVVVAQRKSDETSTSYNIDRMALDNQQILNISSIMSLLPGGKTTNDNIMNDTRIALRSSGSEKGNAAFGTAIEIDGVRLDNNTMMGETSSSSTRNIATSDIESVDIITGIPSVEHGDLSNGIVKVNLRKGKSPYMIEAKMNQSTQQYALSKGMDLGSKAGLLNFSLEHVRSLSNTVSPHTAYQRNVLSVRYNNTFLRHSTPLTLSAGISGNIGGYNSKTDPDIVLDSYSKAHDNMIKGNMELRWLLNKSWITNAELKSSITYQDKLSESYTNSSSASTQPYIHVTEKGYHIAQDYSYGNLSSLDVPSSIILGPTGYWYVKSFTDQKPLTFTLNMKTNWVKRIRGVVSNLTIGADMKTSGNKGKGTYYDQLEYALTWRPYRYDQLPWMENYALYAEEKVTVPLGKRESLMVRAGVRDDITHISQSEYGTTSATAPRISGKYTWTSADRKSALQSFTAHAGYGQSYKLPSFQVLYPAPSYADVLSFTPGSTYDNKAYYAYYTSPTTALYNSNLKWQHTNQLDLGFEAKVWGTKISVSAFYNKTKNPYTTIYKYSTYSYKMTGQQAVEKCGIPKDNRRYSIDEQTGVVTVYDASGTLSPVTLDYTTQQAYQMQRQSINGSDVSRYGLEWIVDFTPIRILNTSLRLDGNYYHYRGLDETLFAGGTSGAGSASSTTYPLVGYYRGSSSTSVGTAASGNVSNGSMTKEVNLNATITTRIPKVRLIMMLRMECSLYSYSRPLSELSDGSQRGVVLESSSDYFGESYDGTSENKYVAVYPEYYATWDNPDKLIPFAEKFTWARDNDRTLYNQMAKLVVKTNYAYIMNPNRISAYCSLNFNITKEIGNHVTLSFYANNFLNSMARLTSSRTGLESSIYNSGYIPRFYYGLSLKIKI